MAKRRRQYRVSGTFPIEERAAVLRRHAVRHAKRGDSHKALVALRQAVALRGEARDWVTLGDALARAGRLDGALDALRQGLYLHRRAGAEGRARTVARMIVALDPLDAKAARIAA